MTALAVRDGDPFWGQMLDCDGHLYMEPDALLDLVGQVGAGFIYNFLKSYAGSPEDLKNRARNREEVFAIKGISALGACDPEGRLEAMERMGIRAQLLFPNTSSAEQRIDSDAARAACRAYNDHALRWTKRTGGRARAVCELNLNDIRWATDELARVIKGGAKGVTLPAASPPGGVSPANEMWDPFWRMLEEADVPAFLHLGTGGIMSTIPSDPMLPPRAWADAKNLRAATFVNRPGGEEAIGPFYFLTAHLSVEVWLQGMIMGKVFERFPRLRFGVIECGGSWAGPMCERMDYFAELMAKVGVRYELKPSEFFRRNVRVTPFWHEDLKRMVDRYGMDEIYCYNTDYPHLEGSKDPIGKFRKWTDRMSDAFTHDFFCENGKLLFPGL